MDDKGPWDEYDLIDSKTPGETVGVRRKNDENGKIFTRKDLLKLQNPVIDDKENMDSHGAVFQNSDGIYSPV
jgi:hypothetical protein